MKAKHVFTTLGLALTMGLGVAAGLSHVREFKQAKAYPSSSWEHVYIVGGFTESSGSFLEMTSSGGDYERTVTMKANDWFKFTNKNSWGDIEVARNWDGITKQSNTCWTDLTTDGGEPDHNFVIKEDGEYRVYMEKDAVEGSWKEAEYGIHIEKVDKDDPSATTKHFYVHDPNSVLGNIKTAADVDKVNVYGFGQSSSIKPMEWPGIHSGVTTAVLGNTDVYEVELSESYPSFIMNCGDGQNQTSNVTDLASHVDEVLVIGALAEGKDKEYTTSWVSDVQYSVPDEDGYYLVGSKTGFKFEGATAMATTGIAPENCAELLDYEAAKDEKIKVRGYFEAENPQNKWSYFGGEETDLGVADGDGNYVLKKAANIDVFAKWVKTSEEPEVWELQFFVTEHAERYNISIYDVLFEGARKASVSETPHVARATENVNFEYELPVMNGYVARELYTDQECTTAYTPSKFNADDTLYAKYTKIAAYMVGDAAFTGSVDTAWTVDGGAFLDTNVVDTVNNRLEGSITISGASKAEPVQVRPASYTAEGTLDYFEYSMGGTYDFAYKESNNIKFTEDGTYQIYVNKTNQIYINAGAAAFYSKFLLEVGSVCNYEGNTNLTNLKSTWSGCEVAYNSLSTAEKNTIKEVGFSGGNPEAEDDLHKMVAKYHYVVVKYAAQGVNDFIWNAYNSSNAINNYNNTAANNTALVVILVSAVAVISAAGLFLVIRRRKHN